MAKLMLTFNERFRPDSPASRRRPQAFRAKVADAKKAVLTELVSAIVQNSPVDTGNYVLSHELASGTEPPPLNPTITTSRGMRRGQPVDVMHDRAAEKLRTQIAAVPDEHTNFLIWNNAVYGFKVEYAGWNGTPPYYVYARAQAEAPDIIRQNIRLFSEALRGEE